MSERDRSDGAQASMEHDSGCFWLRAYPLVDGDEAACCDCGAFEEKAAAHFAALDEGRN